MTTERPFGLVLAGGLARRMGGGDKARIRSGGKAILQRVLTRLTPQCSGVILNANGDLARFADTGLRVVADSIPDFAGPLAGDPARAQLGPPDRPGHCRHRERTGRLSVSALGPGRAPFGSASGGRGAARLRAFRRLAASRGRAMAGWGAWGPAPRGG